MATELESLVVKVDVDLSPLNAAFTKLERFEKRVQALSKQMPNTLSPAVMRGNAVSPSQSKTAIDRLSLAVDVAGLALSVFLPASLLARIGIAVASAVLGALIPEVAKLVSGDETLEGRIARLNKEVQNAEAEIELHEGLLQVDPSEQEHITEIIENAKMRRDELLTQLAEEEVALEALLNQPDPGVGAMAELAEAVEALTGRLDPDLILAMQNVNEMWPVFRDVAFDNLEAVGQEVERLNERLGKLPFGGDTDGGSAAVATPAGSSEYGGPRALGGPVYPGLAFLVGERGPEIFVPDRAGRILPNSFLGGGGTGGAGGGMPGDDFDALIAEIERFGASLDMALGDVPEELREIAETLGGTFIESLEQGRGVMDLLQEAGRQAAGQLLHYLLQSEAVRGELGELADVIENVLNQALNGSIDSWEDLGRVALEVLQAIIEKMVEAQTAATRGGGNGGGIPVPDPTMEWAPTGFGSSAESLAVA